MKRPRVRCFVACPVALLLGVGVFAVPVVSPLPVLAQADQVGHEGHDYSAQQKAEAAINGNKELDAEGKARAFFAFWEGRRKMHPNIGAIALLRSGDALLEAKKAEDAIKVYDIGLQEYANQPASVLLLRGKARALLSQNKRDDAVALLNPQVPLLIRAAQGGHPYHVLEASLALRELALALLEAKEQPKEKAAQAASLLQRVLLDAPVYLEDKRQGAGGWENGWMYWRLVDALIAAGRPKEALGWAKAGYVCCAFDKASIESMSKLLARAWAANDDFGATRAFAKAQEDAAAKDTKNNPLAKVALPAPPKADAATAEARAKRLKSLEEAVRGGTDEEGRNSRTLISAYLLRGDAAGLRAAVDVARGVMKARPEAPEGAAEMCRVIKAVDLNPARANAFIAYLNGEGDNPLPGVLRDIEARGAASAAPAA